MAVQTIKLADEAAVIIDLGSGKAFQVDDPWELEEVLIGMWQNAMEENKRRKEAGSAESLITHNNVRDEIKKYIQTAYGVEISRGMAEALQLLLAAAIAQKKDNWLASFKLNAS